MVGLLYVWVVGEVGVVMVICCYLVCDCGLDCCVIIFMGYWWYGKVLD